MRGGALAAGLVLAAALTAGCKQQCFMTECDYQHYRDIGLPAAVECSPGPSITPARAESPPPATVLEPEREIRYLSLAEAIALALEHGVTGNRFINGETNDELTISFTGGSIAIPQNSIRVLALDPAIIGTEMEASLAKFDARWVSNATWFTTDRPVASPLETIVAGGRTAIEAEDATVGTSLIKPLPTGGVAGITFRTDYEETNLPARLNPAYRPTLQFTFEQPLLQGFGVEINQIRATHPGSTLTPFNIGGRVPGILITRIRFDEQRADFEREVHVMLANVEVAYWNLYGAYGMLFAEEQAEVQAFEAYKINKERFEVHRTSIQNYAQSRAQYQLFRGRRLNAVGEVLHAEHELRGLTGLPVEDGTRLVPADAPTLAPYRPDWLAALNEGLTLRPELVIARNNLKFHQLEVINQKNLLLPDLRFVSSYDINGIGTHLDGGANDPNNAFHSIATDKFNDWSLGLRLDVPLGFRDAHAAVREARLRLARAYGVLQDQENRTQRYIAEQYRRIFQSYEDIKVQRAQREDRQVEMVARFRDFAEGRGPLDRLLEAQRFWSQALRNEYAAIRDYNNSLARFEYAKGTILLRDNVVIGEGPLPQCAQVRAVEHERQRTQALVLKERANPVHFVEQATPPLPDLPHDAAPSMPALMEQKPALPADSADAPEAPACDTPPAKPETLPESAPSPAPAGPTAPAAAADPAPPTFAPGSGSGTAPLPVITNESPTPPPVVAPASWRAEPVPGVIAGPSGWRREGEAPPPPPAMLPDAAPPVVAPIAPPQDQSAEPPAPRANWRVLPPMAEPTALPAKAAPAAETPRPMEAGPVGGDAVWKDVTKAAPVSATLPAPVPAPPAAVGPPTGGNQMGMDGGAAPAARPAEVPPPRRPKPRPIVPIGG